MLTVCATLLAIHLRWLHFEQFIFLLFVKKIYREELTVQKVISLSYKYEEEPLYSGCEMGDDDVALK